MGSTVDDAASNAMKQGAQTSLRSPSHRLADDGAALVRGAVSIFIPVILFAASGPAEGALRVPEDFATIQAAINAASPGDSIDVGPGTYQGTGNVALDCNGKDLTIFSRAGRAVTILDGQTTNRAIRFVSGETSASVLQGFTILNGRDPNRGGGILCTGSSAPTVRDCAIVSCGVGIGGTEARGAGIYLGDTAAPIFDSCEIRNCSAVNPTVAIGGGIFAGVNSQLTLISCQVRDNKSKRDSHNYGHGAGIGIVDAAGAQLTNCDVDANDTHDDYFGGGRGGGLYAATSGALEIVSCRLTENGALSGSAIWAGPSCALTVRESIVRLNFAFGAAIDANSCTLEQCLIIQNRGGEGEGGQGPGGVALSSGVSLIESCTIARTTGSHGSALVIRNSATATVRRSIVWGSCTWPGLDDAAIRIDAGGSLLVECCALDPARVDGSVTYVGQQVFSEPFFCDPGSCFFGAATDADGFHLAAISPCLPPKSPCGELIGARGEACGTAGACCMELECQVMSPDACASFDGDYAGNGTECEPDCLDPADVVVGDARGGGLLQTIGPNPARDEVRTRLSVAVPGRVQLDLFDVAGRHRRSLFDDWLPAGEHSLETRLALDGGASVPAGVYQLRISHDGKTESRALVISR